MDEDAGRSHGKPAIITPNGLGFEGNMNVKWLRRLHVTYGTPSPFEKDVIKNISRLLPSSEAAGNDGPAQ